MSELDPTIVKREAAARRYVEHLRAFYVHGSLFVVGMLIMFMVNLLANRPDGLSDDWTAWWSAWALLGWSIGIAVHGLIVWLNRPSFTSSNWEQRQIDKILDR